MKRINIKAYEVTVNKNNGINKEWSLCRYFGIERTTHDRIAYDKGSDIELDTMNISVKTPSATLMCGSLCKGCKTFEGIWRRFRKNTHSDTFAVVLSNCDAYFMNIDEFSKFIHKFSNLDRESKKNGGGIKIKLYDESKKMRNWLEANCK